MARPLVTKLNSSGALSPAPALPSGDGLRGALPVVLSTHAARLAPQPGRHQGPRAVPRVLPRDLWKHLPARAGAGQPDPRVGGGGADGEEPVPRPSPPLDAALPRPDPQRDPGVRVVCVPAV
ncbi:hypothetical protein GWK47_035651 [Chionoecetes opilio]|uniref:Uncharacterized protein n=1 Tax=Chionoecetes opilio TaxID=41210 RepID=A0A8J4YF38_CHIOP|nr:hypothetical protein GWK47_035651 [Chionoecetes opilio]